MLLRQAIIILTYENNDSFGMTCNDMSLDGIVTSIKTHR